MKFVALMVVGVCGVLLIYGTLDFPAWRDPNSPASTYVSPYYIQTAMKDTSVPNIVTAVLADYRSYDTLFETVVIFSAGIACFFLLRVFKEKTAPETRLYRHVPTGITIRIKKGGKLPSNTTDFERIDLEWVPYDLIIKTTCRLIIPFIQLFALYVIVHGHYSPGGGFQGGVILGATFILYAISHDLRSTFARMSERASVFFSTAGVFIYTGVGVVCLLLGRNFLDYSALAPIFGVDPVTARSHAILIVEIGVGMAVMAVMVSLYFNLSSVGKHDEGL